MPKLIKQETPFFSEHNERETLASFELSTDAAIVLNRELMEEHFVKPEHQRLFKIFSQLILKGDLIKPSRVTQLIPHDDIPLQTLYRSLSEEEPIENEIPKYIQSLKYKLKYRRLQDTHKELGNKLQNGTEDPTTILNKIQDDVINISSETPSETDDSLLSILTEQIPDPDNIEPIEGGLLGMPTSIKGLDTLTLGWQKGHLIIIAGRPSTGKTELAIQNAVHCADETKKPILIFSIETNKNSLFNRILSHLTTIDMQNIRMRRFNDDQKKTVKEQLEFMKGLPLIIVDDPIMTVSKIHSRIRKEQYIHGEIGLVLIDYLQLIKGSHNNRVQEVAQISWGLKILAKQLNVPIIALSQLSRSIETRGDTWTDPPNLSDLRDSGSIEQDADEVLFITTQPRQDVETGHYLSERQSRLWLQKQKDGPTGCVHVINKCSIGRFVENDNANKNSGTLLSTGEGTNLASDDDWFGNNQAEGNN